MVGMAGMSPVRLLTLGEGLTITFAADELSIFFMCITTLIFLCLSVALCGADRTGLFGESGDDVCML